MNGGGSKCLALFLAAFAPCPMAVGQEHPAPPPNVLVIMADDMGYADAGCYGGEIETPGIDRLAAEGVRFTHFRSTPMCVTTRVAFLSGMSYQDSGRGAYRGVTPLPERFRRAGYRTYAVGKWHAGNHHPVSETFFDRFFGFLSGMTDCYAGGEDWFKDDQPYRDFAGDFDATTRFTDQGIAYMKEAMAMNKPFFLFMAYNAPHHPLQARRETYEKYLARYEAGYEAVREARLERQRALGILEPGQEAAPRPGPEVRRWEEMPPFRQKVEDMRMAAYAAMVDEMDQGIVRLLDFLDANGLAEETLVVFLSDNGGYFNNGSIHEDHQHKPWQPGSNQTISNGWGWVQNTPFSLYKQSCHEGGLATPCIIRWAGLPAGSDGTLTDLQAEVIDLYPTLAELIGEDDDLPERGRAGQGQSFLSALTEGTDFRPPPRFHWFGHSRAWIEGDMKAVAHNYGPWRLYDLAVDRAEQHDLSGAQPERTAAMAHAWQTHAETTGMNARHRSTAMDEQNAWGWHRLKMFCDQLTTVFPENGKLTEPGSTAIEMHFAAPVHFPENASGRISLHSAASDRSPLWEIRPDSGHPSHGKRVLRFEDLPALEPDTSYFVLVSNAAFSVGGLPVGTINDGAYWWRFRTK